MGKRVLGARRRSESARISAIVSSWTAMSQPDRPWDGGELPLASATERRFWRSALADRKLQLFLVFLQFSELGRALSSAISIFGGPVVALLEGPLVLGPVCGC